MKVLTLPALPPTERASGDHGGHLHEICGKGRGAEFVDGAERVAVPKQWLRLCVFMRTRVLPRDHVPHDRLGQPD